MGDLELAITIAEIVDIHDRSLVRFGGLPGMRAEGCLEQVHGNAMLAEQYSGNEDGSLGLCFVGSLMYYLIKGQCFVDGNKRTGLGVTLYLLEILGLTLQIEELALKEHCELIAIDTKMQSGDVVRWLADRLVALDEAVPDDSNS